LFITARLLFPTGNDDIIDLKKFYYLNYRKIFLFGAILALLSILHDVIMRESAPEDFVGPTFVFTTLSFMAALNISKPLIHKIIAILMLFALIASIIIQWNEWLIVN
jgi:hypothetical protein